MKKLLLLPVALLSINTYAHDVVATAPTQYGYVNYPTNVGDFHAVRLYNGADYPVSLTYRYTLCVDGVKRCAEQSNTVQLAPHSGNESGWTNQQNLLLSYRFIYPGSYHITSTTSIEGEGGKKIVGHGTLFVK